MATIDVECPECAMPLLIEEEQLGTVLTCPKCKFAFEAEKSGGAYELSEPAIKPRDPARPRRAEGGAGPKGADRPETDEERRLRERMERWADES